jgi:hypothetical protein
MPLIYAGIMPFGLDPNAASPADRVVFLLGREQREDGWSGSSRWSDFGGGPDGQSSMVAASREGYEETMGVVGTKNTIRKRLYEDLRLVTKEHGGSTGHTYLYPLGYKPYLPHIYNNIFTYFRSCAKQGPNGRYRLKGCPDGWYEKDQIRWFSARQLRNVWKGQWNTAMDGPKPRFRPEFYGTLQTMFETWNFKHGYPSTLKKILKSHKL